MTDEPRERRSYFDNPHIDAAERHLRSAKLWACVAIGFAILAIASAVVSLVSK
jgi:hypothetical protein